MLDVHEIRVDPVGHLGAEGQHLGAEGRDHARVGLLGLLGVHGGLVHRREVVAHVGQWRLVLVTAQTLDEGLVTHPETEHEALVEGGVQGASGVHRGHRVAPPDVGDARRHRQCQRGG